MKRSLLNLGLAVGILGIALAADAAPRQRGTPRKDRQRPRAERRVDVDKQFTNALRQYGEAYKNGDHEKAGAIAKRLRGRLSAAENRSAKPNRRIRRERPRTNAEIGGRRWNERTMRKERRLDRERRRPRGDGIGRRPVDRGEQARRFAMRQQRVAPERRGEQARRFDMRQRRFARERRGEMERGNQPRAKIDRRPRARMAQANRGRRSEAGLRRNANARTRECPLMRENRGPAMRPNRRNPQARQRPYVR